VLGADLGAARAPGAGDGASARARAVEHARRRPSDRLTDGIAAEPGDAAVTDLTAVLASSGAFVVYDLGAVTPVRCALVEADGDDRYTLSLSADGQGWLPLWTAGPADERGMQLRVGRDLAGSAATCAWRRLAGTGATRWPSWPWFAACPARFPPGFALQKGTPVAESVRTKFWALAALAAAYVLAYAAARPTSSSS